MGGFGITDCVIQISHRVCVRIEIGMRGKGHVPFPSALPNVDYLLWQAWQTPRLSMRSNEEPIVPPPPGRSTAAEYVPIAAELP